MELGWILTGWNIHLLHRYAPATAAMLDTPGSYARGNDPGRNPVLDGFHTTPALGYRSYSAFAADVAAGAIGPWFRAVLYDNENWPGTPAAEQQDPWAYLALFGQLAHANGLLYIATPARDLGNVATSRRPKRPGETLDEWYVRTNIAGAAAGAADIAQVQAQVHTASVPAFARLVSQARPQALAASRDVKVYGGLSTNHGSPDQMAAAASSAKVDGFYVTASSSAITQLEAFLRRMRR
ncbi:MAG TPA: hypothetical protein VMH35_14745 [Streptosporangiaceae bacterium]|nr:hypothetical protein [Streptosporangiaceae bacterium]